LSLGREILSLLSDGETTNKETIAASTGTPSRTSFPSNCMDFGFSTPSQQYDLYFEGEGPETARIIVNCLEAATPHFIWATPQVPDLGYLH
jgi:hypothetical protein